MKSTFKTSIAVSLVLSLFLNQFTFAEPTQHEQNSKTQIASPTSTNSDQSENSDLDFWLNLAKETPIDPDEYGEGLKALAEHEGIDLSVPEDEREIYKDIQSTLKETAVNINIQTKANLFTRLVIFGHKKALYKKIESIVKKLALPGEPDYIIKVSPNPIPNASISVDKSPHTLTINFGLLAISSNEDDLAGIIAHEMTHAHKKIFEADEDIPHMKSVLEKLDAYKGLPPSQREEIRADLGAVHRMIKAGYNPWGMYNFQKNMTEKINGLLDQKIMNFIISNISKKSAAYISSHPAGEIRMAAVKSYILARGTKEDLSEHTSKYTKLSLSLKLLKFRSQVIVVPLFNKWVNRGIWAYILFTVLSSVGATDLEFMREIIRFTSVSYDSLDVISQPYISPLKQTLGQIFDQTWGPIKEILNIVWTPVEQGLSQGKEQIPNLELSSEQRETMGNITIGGTIGVFSAYATWVLDVLFYQIPMDFESENLKLIQKIKNNRVKLRGITNYFIKNAKQGQFDTKIFSRVLDQQISNYEKIEGLYHLNTTAHTFRLRNGLLLSQIITANGISRLVEELFRYQQTLAQSNSDANFLNIIGNSLEKIPSSLLTNEDLAETLITLLQIPTYKTFKDLITSGDFEKETKTDKLQLKVKLQLLTYYNENYDKETNLTPEDQLRFAYILTEYGFKTEAYPIIRRNYADIYNFVYSGENKDSSLARIFTNVVTQVKDQGTLSAPNLGKQLIIEQQILNTQVSGLTNPVDTAKAYSATAEVPLTTNKWFSIRYWLQKYERNKLLSYFENNFKSIYHLKSFVETELIPENIQLDQLKYILNLAISHHPEWLADKKDFDALLSVEYFWPTFDSEGVNPSSYEGALVEILKKKTTQYPEIWKYEPSGSERLHHVYIQRLKYLNMYPSDFDGIFSLWQQLTKKGVSSVTDEIFHSLYQSAPPDKVTQLEDMALKGFVWEAEIKAEIHRSRLHKSKDFLTLKASTDKLTRFQLLQKILKQIQTDFPERGGSYKDVLEELSQEIRSSPEESQIIHEAKTISTGEKQEDLSLRVFSDFINRVTTWDKEDQWNLILFLRGDAEAGPEIQKAFRLIGPERVRRMFSLFPQVVRTQLLDTMLDSPSGLIPNLKPNRGYGKKIIDYLLKNSKPESRQIASEILEAFLYSLNATGNKPLQSYVVSYLLALPKGQQSTGHILKSVLEVFGTTGIKIGQFLAASQLLPEEEAAFLRQLQERANPPERQNIFEDIELITDKKGLPIILEDLLGSASLKYAVSAIETSSNQKIVIKILRLEAIANTRTQFNQLEKMAEYLTKNYGPKYGVFKGIVSAARAAVERELSLKGESLKSKIASQKIYKNLDDAMSIIQAPREILLNNRMLGAEFAEGTSIYEVPEEKRDDVALKILEIESNNLFRPLEQATDLIIFDPDRHPGNNRNGVLVNGKITIRPIDFGQMQTISKKQREQLLSAFALSQILARTGSTDWALEKTKDIFELDQKAFNNLKKTMKKYFPAQNLREVTAYYTLLSALTDAGFKMDIVFYDYIRAIIQLSQYEPFIKSDTKRERHSPVAILKRAVKDRADNLLSQMNLTGIEKLKAGTYEAARKRNEQKIKIIKCQDLVL